MNRHQRRAAERASTRRGIHRLQRKVATTGRPGIIQGLTGACRDCGADGSIVLLPGGESVGQIHHDEHCPAAAGVTTWEPCPLDEQEETA